MTGLLALFARWRSGIPIAAVMAALGLVLALIHYRGAYQAEQALRRADQQAYVNAQAQAALIAEAALRSAQTRYKEKADEADARHETALADARSRASAYIDRMRLKTAARPASTAIASAQGGGAQSAVRSGAAPDMVAISAADIDVCTINTARLEAAREWALGL
jgi:hypothetical protein